MRKKFVRGDEKRKNTMIMIINKETIEFPSKEIKSIITVFKIQFPTPSRNYVSSNPVSGYKLLISLSK